MMSKRKGVTLTELMISLAIISIGVLGMIGAFRYFNIGLQSSKSRSLANNIAQERIEFLKNKSYYRVLVTTQPAYDYNFTPTMVYDQAPNGEDTVNVGGLNFIRRVYIRKVNEDTSGKLDYLDWTDPDPGLKEIKVYVVWFERGEWRKLELRNLRENPARTNQSATVSGWVKDFVTMADLNGVVVRAQENPSQYGETNASGEFSFTIEPGTYTLLATKDGYFPFVRPSFGVVSGGIEPYQDFLLTQMSSGTLTGKAWLRDHLVISQVVGSSVNSSGFFQEWIEVYNPTTWTWTMATGLNSGVIGVAYQLRNQPLQIIDLDYLTLTVAPQHYYLFSNTGTVTSAGVNRNADAVFRPGNAGYPNIIKINTDAGNDAAGVGLGWLATLTGIDAVGWKTGGQSPAMTEGSPIDQVTGLELNEMYIRRTQPGSLSSGFGRAYDTNNNSNDFAVLSPASYPPKNSADMEVPLSGTPAAGAIVFANDSLSGPVTAGANGAFNLVSVATGAWTVFASSGISFSSVAYDCGSSGGFVGAVGDILLSHITEYGYATGRVTNTSGAPLQGIKMFSAGGTPVSTDVNGRYTLPVAAGIVTVIANYQSQNPSYVELSSTGINVGLGEVAKDVDFSLYFGGRIRGRVTTNGLDPLPNIPVVGLKDGVEQGSGISDADGYFMISGAGVSTGTYQVVPQLEAGESSSPSSTTVVLAAGAVAFSSTYTVSGAFGYVSGSVHTGSAAGPVITTGVLIYVTTATLAAGAYPPDITPALRAGTGVYYAASSNALGGFNIPVKGGYSYNIYAWYTVWSNGNSTTERKEYLGVAVSPMQTVSRVFSW